MDRTEISPDLANLEALALDALFAGVTPATCEQFSLRLYRLRGESTTRAPERDAALQYVFRVLSLRLRAEQVKEPFGPEVSSRREPGTAPGMFSRETLKVIFPWTQSLSDPELRSRFMDLIWVRSRVFAAATGAVAAYVESAKRLEHPEHWPPAQRRLERALRLSFSLGQAATDLQAMVLGEIKAILGRHRGTDPLFLTYRLAKLVLEFDDSDALIYAEYAKTGARLAMASGNFVKARKYLSLAAQSYKHAGDREKANQYLLEVAQSHADEAEAVLESRGATVAASFMSDAVTTFKRVKGGRKRADELMGRLHELQQASLSEMHEFKVSTDVSEARRASLATVDGLSLKDAVWEFCGMGPISRKAALREDVIKRAKSQFFGNMWSLSITNARGRIVAKAPGLMSGTEEEVEAGVRYRMHQLAGESRVVLVRAVLQPVLEHIAAVHSPDREDVLDLIRHSSWIPPTHVESIIRALRAGLDGDMLVAGYMVPLLIEAVLRHVVELQGGITVDVDAVTGIQTERGLGPLLDTPEALTALGEDAVFELQGLLVDNLGSNFRNEVAHGLRGDKGLFDVDTFYAWFLLLRLCVMTSRLAEIQHASTPSEEVDDTEAPGQSIADDST